MSHVKEFRPGTPPADSKENIAGAEEAIEKTKKKIAEYKTEGLNASEFEFHLKRMEQYLKNLKNKKS